MKGTIINRPKVQKCSVQSQKITHEKIYLIESNLENRSPNGKTSDNTFFETGSFFLSGNELTQKGHTEDIY